MACGLVLLLNSTYLAAALLLGLCELCVFPYKDLDGLCPFDCSPLMDIHPYSCPGAVEKDTLKAMGFPLVFECAEKQPWEDIPTCYKNRSRGFYPKYSNEECDINPQYYREHKIKTT